MSDIAPGASASGWSTAPAMPARWQDFTAAEATAIAARIGAAVAAEKLPGIAMAAALRRIRGTPLAFYPNWLLLECEGALPDGDIGVVSFLYGPGARIVLLDFTSAPIHDVNVDALAGLDDPAVATDYLRFFCAHIVGDDGRFRIVDSPADIEWASGKVAVPAGKDVSRIAPLTPLPPGDGDDQRPAFRATILYGASLFTAELRMDMEGHVEMVDDTPIACPPIAPERIAPPFRLAPRRGDRT
jgi:hypothetical protein